MSNFVFVLDPNKQMLNPVHPGEARCLLSQGKAAVFRRYPFTIILKQEAESEIKPLQLKIDPGSKTTGLAILNGSKVVWAAELTHRGQAIKNALLSRSQLRRGRRNRKTRYRAPRFLNRTRAEGWLAPSLMHRVKTTLTWVNRLCRYAPIAGISQELVRFDTQVIQNPEISGTEYQQGTLAGYEVREYLLDLPKTHWLDAACVGRVNRLEILTTQPLLIKATGHGTRKMCGTNKYGFPFRHRSRVRIHKGFQTGDIIVANVTAGKKIGSYLGRVLCRASGSFDIATKMGKVAGISHKYCKSIHKRDGYAYAL
ncbi:RNA-guided endonuclease IscB [Phormidium yuhuli AB48]|uniref:RNA-guided endonuclease IscB n=1 Tax=Phormidium yuhuli AB48 TaxID=2940671 RepID=A0ABY5AQR1_9CYAN|nr:RNA-guided endonuclease IscB [Phormidium yuhuli]USR91150.1 RNA-guided endonuclease IscB [Phormidium yuhuli AB48]